MADRFWSKVDVRGPDDCWEWTRAKNKVTGYGHYNEGPGGRRSVTAHKLAYALNRGIEIPVGRDACVLHHCDNKLCCNPAHLYLGTFKDNARDRVERGLARGGSMPGQTNPNVKITADQAAAIRANEVTHREAKSRFGVSQTQYYRIRRGECW